MLTSSSDTLTSWLVPHQSLGWDGAELMPQFNIWYNHLHLLNPVFDLDGSNFRVPPQNVIFWSNRFFRHNFVIGNATLLLPRRHKVTGRGFRFMKMLIDPSFPQDVFTVPCLGEEKVPS
jgi:hypothetical protein